MNFSNHKTRAWLDGTSRKRSLFIFMALFDASNLYCCTWTESSILVNRAPSLIHNNYTTMQGYMINIIRIIVLRRHLYNIRNNRSHWNVHPLKGSIRKYLFKTCPCCSFCVEIVFSATKVKKTDLARRLAKAFKWVLSLPRF